MGQNNVARRRSQVRMWASKKYRNLKPQENRHEYGGGHLEPGYSEVALKVYNTTPLTDKYVRVSKIERIGDALQSILKIKKIDGC